MDPSDVVTALAAGVLVTAAANADGLPAAVTAYLGVRTFWRALYLLAASRP